MKIGVGILLLSTSFGHSQAGEDCDKEIYIASPRQINQDISGKYIFKEKLNDKPAYRHESKDFYLFFAGHWKVEPQSKYGSVDSIGYIKTDKMDNCPLNLGKNWRGYMDTGPDPQIRVLSLSDSNYKLTDIGSCDSGVAFSGVGVIRTIINVESARACDFECSFDGRCSFFSWDVGTNQCELRNDGSRVSLTYHVAGLKGCSQKTGNAGSSLALLEPHMISGLGISFSLRSTQKYWNSNGGAAFVESTEKTFKTRFLIEKVTNQTIRLKGPTGKYLSLTPSDKGAQHIIENEVTPSDKAEFEVFPNKGRIALRSKKSGKFLTMWLDNGRSWLAATAGGLNENNLFNIESASIRNVKEKIVKIEWKNMTSPTSISPTAAKTKTIINKGSKDAEKTMTMTWSKETSQSTSWEHNWGLSVGVSATAGTDIGVVSAEITVSAEASYGGSNVQDTGKATTLELSEETKVVIPANKRVVCKLMLQKQEDAELPFTATIERESDAGVSTIYQDGVWRGVVVYNSYVEITEESIP